MQNGTDIIYGDVSNSNKVSDTLNAIFTYDNLYDAYKNAIKGVRWKYTTQSFMFNACCRIARIYREIQDKKFVNGEMHFFKVCERGKTRNISALPLKDRIVHKCLCDNYLTPLLKKSLTYDCGATLKEKGLSFTRRRVVAHLEKYYHKYKTNKGYVLKADFHNYFESIDHDILFNQLSKVIDDEETLNFIKYIIPDKIKGLGLGSQVSQICALYYVSNIDHYLKEKMRFKYFGRYMDDLYIISPSKAKLYKAKKYLKEALSKLNVELSENKTQIYKLENGFVFCKCRYILTDTGKVLKLIASKTISSFNRKIKNGYDISPSIKGFVQQFNAHKICRKLLNAKENLNYVLLQKQKRKQGVMLTSPN